MLHDYYDYYELESGFIPQYSELCCWQSLCTILMLLAQILHLFNSGVYHFLSLLFKIWHKRLQKYHELDYVVGVDGSEPEEKNAVHDNCCFAEVINDVAEVADSVLFDNWFPNDVQKLNSSLILTDDEVVDQDDDGNEGAEE